MENNKEDKKIKKRIEDEKKEHKKRKIKVIILVTSFILIIGVALIYYYFFMNSPKTESPKKKSTIKKQLTIVDENSNQRPIAVMYDNNVGNYAHAGLQDSYINYEIIVEGGLTRIMALFKDKDVALIGPVRSSRHYFLDYAIESDAIYTHYGWSTYAENDIKSLHVNNINGLYDDEPFWRDSKIAAPHNVFTSTNKIYEYAKKKNYKTTSNDWKLLNYTTDNVVLNKPIGTKTVKNEETGKNEKIDIENPELIKADSLSIPYSNYQIRSYQYNSDKKVYMRFMNGEAHIDKITNQQLSFKNIIIEKVSNRQLDSYGRQDLNTTPSGEGYYITNGYALPVKWNKESRTSKTIYKYSNGKEVKINDGNTFIQIIPEVNEPTFE